jgi:hypothetical protein
MRRRHWIVGASVLTVIAMVGGGMSFASAADESVTAPPEVQKEIDETLAKVPGGTQIGPYEISWDNGDVIMVFPDASGFIPQTPEARLGRSPPPKPAPPLKP